MTIELTMALLPPSISSTGLVVYGLLAAFFILFPIYGAWEMRRYRQREAQLSAADKAAERMTDYRKTIAVLWTATALVGVLFAQGALTAEQLFLLPKFGLLGTGLALVGCALMLFQARGYASPKLKAGQTADREQEASREQLRAKTREQLGHVEPLMPRNRRELHWFYGLSLTAGICEEVLFRGFLVAALTPTLGFWGAALVSTLAFGYGHIYQGGLYGFVRTAIIGAIFMLIVYWAGSIWPAVLLHAVMDFVGGFIGFHCLKDETQDGGSLDEAPALA